MYYVEFISTEEWVIVYSMIVVMQKHCSAVADKCFSFSPCTPLFMHCCLLEIFNFIDVTLSCKNTFGCISDATSCQVGLNTIVLVQCKQCWRKEEKLTLKVSDF